MTHPGGGAARGAELASGYISLSVKYTNAMQQISKDFGGLEQQAAKTGEKAGAAMGTAITSGVTKNTRYAMDTAGIDMTSRANKIGAGIGYALSTAIGGGVKDIEKIGGAAFKGLESVAMNSIKGIGHGLRELATGPMVQILGATSLFGAAFATIEKGWKLDTMIQDTQVRLESFGGSAQDVAGFMQSVNDSLKGTANGFTDVAEIATSLFHEGVRGHALTDELKVIQDVAAASGRSIESISAVFEKFHGRDVLNAMALGQLEPIMPAREALEKSLNVTSDGLDDLLKKGKVTFDTLWEAMAQGSEGAAEKMSHTWSGQFHKMGINVAQIGGDLLKGSVGGGGGFEGINSGLEKLDGWINSHQNEIKNFFHEMGSAAGVVANGVGWIVDKLGSAGNAVKLFAGLFVAWESIKGIAAVIQAFSLISTAVSGASTLVSAFASGPLALMGVNLGIVASEGPLAAGGITASGVAAEGAAGRFAILEAALTPVVASLAAIAAGYAAADAFVHSDAYTRFEQNNPFADNPVSRFLNRNTPDFLGGDVTDESGRFPKPQTIPPAPPPPPSSKNPLDVLRDASAPHAMGGIGGLPGRATIQSPMGAGGLVQWAEDSTGGEAYIPLARAKRKRSLEIWRQTGKLLGMDDGGVIEEDDPRWQWWSMGNKRRGGNNGPHRGFGNWGTPFMSKLLEMIGAQSSPVMAFDGGGIRAPDPGNKGAEGWRYTVADIVKKYGPQMNIPQSQYGYWTSAIVTQIATESGGNPGAQNPNDSTGHGGTQSVHGLLQYLPSSYAGSGGKLTGLPLMDPVGQIAGALFAPHNAAGGPAIGAPGGIGTPGRGWGPTGGSVASGNYGSSGPSGSSSTSGSSGSSSSRSTISGSGSGSSSYSGQTNSLSSETGGVGGPSTSQQEAQDRRERTLNDRIVNLNNDIGVLEQKQSEQTDKTKQSEKDRVQADLDRKKTDLTNAQSDLTQLQQDWNSKVSGGKSSGGGGTGGGGSSMGGLPDFGGLADIGMKGITESLLPPGFMNPMDSPILKGIGGVLKFMSGLGAKHGGPLGGTTGGVLGMLGGFASGSPGAGINSLMQSFQSQPYGQIQAGSPGQAPYVDPTGLFGNSGSMAIISPDGLPGLNSIQQQANAPHQGSGASAGPGGPQSQPGQPGTVNDFRGAQFGTSDVGGVLKDRDLSQARKHATSTDRNNMPGAH